MTPEDVKPEWVEKGLTAVDASDLDDDFPPGFDTEVFEFPAELEWVLRHALAAVLPEAMAEAWDEGKGALAAAWHPDAAPLINPYREGSPS